MPKTPHTPPSFEGTAFNCPHCHAYAKQGWADAWAGYNGKSMADIHFSFCTHCGVYSLWHQRKLIYPDFVGIEPPNPDLSPDIVADYQEAAKIVSASPRGAAALLRLAVQKLCKQLGRPGNNINDDIAALVKDGLPEKIQKALDTVRVTGNEAVHPGTFDLKDDSETVNNLFKLVNFIAQKMITEPKEVDTLYDSLPTQKKEEIAKRDGSAKI